MTKGVRQLTQSPIYTMRIRVSHFPLPLYPDGTDAQTVYDANGRKVAAIDPNGDETDYR